MGSIPSSSSCANARWHLGRLRGKHVSAYEHQSARRIGFNIFKQPTGVFVHPEAVEIGQKMDFGETGVGFQDLLDVQVDLLGAVGEDLGVGQEIDLKRKLRVQRNRNIFRSSVLLGASSSKTSERLLYSIKVGLHESVQAQA